MPKPNAAGKADLTFIVGNPRSRQNLSRIRAHASRATRKTVDDLDVPRTSYTATPPSESSHAHNDAPSIVSNDVNSKELQVPITRHRPWTPESSVADFDHLRQPEECVSSRGSDREPSIGVTSDRASTPPDLVPRLATRRFSIQGSTLGTWWERYPEAESLALGLHSFDSHKRSRALEQEEHKSCTLEASTETSTKNSQNQATTQLQPRAADPSASTRSATTEESPRRHDADENPHGKKRSQMAKEPRAKRSAQQKMQSRWRVGSGLSKAVVLAPTHPLTQFESILRQTTIYYDHSFDTIWEPLLRQNRLAFEKQSDFELFDESMLSAAALIEAGQVNKAAHLIMCIVEMLVHLMHQSHPEAYFIFLILSLQTNRTAIAQLRSQLREHLLPVAERVLGPDHPITQILQLHIPIAARGQLQTAVLRKIREFNHRKFGEASQQTTAIDFHSARALSDLGNTEDALTIISSAIRDCERYLGLNALGGIYLLIEKAAILMEQSPPDTSMLPELHLSDIIRRLQVITQEIAKMPEESVEAQKMELAVVHAKIATLRMLGRLHGLRKNYGAAVQVFSQVLQYATMMLGGDAVPTHLAQADLEAIKIEELKDQMDSISLTSVDGKDAPKPSKTKYHTARTAVGVIESMNRNYVGEGADEIPHFKRMVLGFTVVGMPAFCHTVVI